MSKRIPFNISKALKSPSRVRHIAGHRAVAIAHFPTAHEEYRVVVQWADVQPGYDVSSYTESGKFRITQAEPELYLDPEQVEGEA